MTKEICPKCGTRQYILRKPRRTLRHAVPALNSPFEVMDPYVCAKCGCEVKSTVWFDPTDGKPLCALPVHGAPDAVDLKYRGSFISNFSDRAGATIAYMGVMRTSEGILFPTQEGSIWGGGMIDRYGNPDLMAEFAREYQQQYHAIAPSGFPPARVSKMMPALHLLVNATELALKAYLIRSEVDSRGHTLTSLYARLEPAHRDEIERRFAESEPKTNLHALGLPGPCVKSVLGFYAGGCYLEKKGSVTLENNSQVSPTRMALT